jgi:hypothetical protein
MYAEFRFENLKGKYHSEERRRCEDNIKKDLNYIGWNCMDWIDGVQDKWVPVNTVMNLRVP